MAFCSKCGNEMENGAKFCPSCGASAEPAREETDRQVDYGAKIQALNDTADTTAEYAAADIQQNKAMAILAYLGILVLIPLFAAKESKFARYHTNQGLVLAIAEIAYAIVLRILTAILLAISWRLLFLTSILGILSLLFVALAIIGIVNAANGRAKELPIIGKIKLLK